VQPVIIRMAGVAAGFSSSIGMVGSMTSAIVTGLVFDGTAHSAAFLVAGCTIAAILSLRLARSAPSEHDA
jgi:nitrate/nitrite transporter NarK